jgi:formylmethanofuran dehydrogenase subunit D
MVKRTRFKKAGFILEVTPEVATALGVDKQDDVRIIVRDNEVILMSKKENPEHKKRQQEENKKLTKKLIKKFSPVLKKLSNC